MRNLSVIIVASIALTGCAGFDHVVVPTPPKPKPPKICQEIDLAEPIDPQEACPSWRRIALKTDPGSECPDPSEAGRDSQERWTIAHLFSTGAKNVDRASAEYAAGLPPALRPFCLYEYKKNAPRILGRLNDQLDSLIGTEGAPNAFQRVDFGCAAIGPASDDSEMEPESNGPGSDLWKGLDDYFLEQIGHVEPVTVLGPGSPDENHKPRVRLSFLDTQPIGMQGPGAKAQHGYALSQIARTIACDKQEETSGRCAAEIDYRLALPISGFDRNAYKEGMINMTTGGYSGSVDILATAVWDAIRDQERNPGQHLVLNLSVAWDGKLFGGLEANVAAMPVTAQAMYRALEVASCRGALVVAAAGNLRGGPGTEHGPLLPGGWELRDAPTRDACRGILGLESETQALRCALPEPLVYAAGGVRFDNSPLYNARPGGTPQLVAYANRAWVEGLRKPFTGTSVGTAVISTTASVVWHHWPYLTRAELMDLLYRSGEPIARAADFHHGSFGERPEASRIAVCPTLARACAELGGTCPDECQQPRKRSSPWSRAGVSCSKTIDAGKITKQLEHIPFCGDRTILYDPAMGIPTDPCPTKQFYGSTAKSWHDDTLPQPEDDPCMGCGSGGEQSSGLVGLSTGSLASSGARSLVIEIDSEWKKTLSQAFLDIGDYSLALSVGELKANGCALVKNLDIDRFAGNESNPYVVLRFRTEDQRVVSVPLLF